MAEVTLKWLEEKRFVGIDAYEHSIVIGGSGKPKIGIRPVDLVLLALGSCLGYDVVHVLERKRQKLEDFEVIVTGKMKTEAPWTFTDFHVKFRLWGCELSEKAVQDAIRIASDQLCGVSDLLRKGATITKVYEILESKPRLVARRYDSKSPIDNAIRKWEEQNKSP